MASSSRTTLVALLGDLQQMLHLRELTQHRTHVASVYNHRACVGDWTLTP